MIKLSRVSNRLFIPPHISVSTSHWHKYIRDIIAPTISFILRKNQWRIQYRWCRCITHLTREYMSFIMLRKLVNGNTEIHYGSYDIASGRTLPPSPLSEKYSRCDNNYLALQTACEKMFWRIHRLGIECPLALMRFIWKYSGVRMNNNDGACCIIPKRSRQSGLS